MLTKKIITLALTTDTDFENFESISIIDAGAADGFQVKGETADGKASDWITVPTGIPYNLGAVNGRTISKLQLKAASGKSLNASVSIIY